MNCKPGDLAYYVGRSRPDLVGRVCEVLQVGIHEFSGGPADGCVVQFSEKCRTTSGDLSVDGWVKQTSLRPIRDPGDDATDEMVQLLGKPSEVTA